MNEVIEKHHQKAIIKLPPLAAVEGPLLIIPSQILLTLDGGSHRACAAILDAQLTLKALYAKAILGKQLANLGYAKTPLFPVTATVATVVHIDLDLAILHIVKEWLIVKGIETGVGFVSPLKIVVRELIPIISVYGDRVAGPPWPGPVRRASATNNAINLSTDELRKENVNDTNGLVEVFPPLTKLRLPIVAEPPPTSLGVQEIPPIVWESSDKKQTVGPTLQWIDKLIRYFSSVNDLLEPINTVINGVRSIVGDNLLQSVLDGIVAGLGIPGLQIQIPPETIDIPVDVTDALGATWLIATSDDNFAGFDDNPSLGSLPKLNVRAERSSQWVRATYPYLDSMRASLRPWLKYYVPNSSFSTYLVHWSNRYTLAESCVLRRSGSLVSPHMYVMLDRDSATKDKGQELWVRKSPVLAEQHFTLLGFIHRPTANPTFFGSGIVFSNFHRDGKTAIAQAMIYNANGNRVNPSRDQSRQPDTGWDTLNWLPPVIAPEWGSEPAYGFSRAPWEVVQGDFDGSFNPPEFVRVKLNWQAKLVPATQTRIEQAYYDAEVSDSIRRTLSPVSKEANQRLLTH